MALETHLMILDYLGTQKGTNIFDYKQNIFKDENVPLENNFKNIFSTCCSKQNKSRLTASDYLTNPVRKKPDAFFEIPDLLLFNMRAKQVWQTQESATTEYAQTEQRSGNKSIQEDIEYNIKKASKKYGLPYNLIKGVIKAESDFQIRAESSAGAQGLMQLMPATARELGVKDPFDINQNIDAGSRYLKKMMNRFEGDPKKALAAYNAGPGTVEKYNGNVPYTETKRYVTKVLDYAGLAA